MKITQPRAVLMSLIVTAGMTGFAYAAQTSSSQKPNTEMSQSQNNGYSQAMVREAQQKLKNDGYYTGNIDGEDGPETQAAIKKYQEANNLTANGQLDNETCKKLKIKKH